MLELNPFEENNTASSGHSTPELNVTAKPSRATGSLRDSAAEPQTSLGAGSNPLGAPPSNTAPSNPEDGPSVRILRFAVDSLYLSYPGELHPGMARRLDALKTLAQSDNPTEAAKAQLVIGDHIFMVSDRGRTGFPYKLIDNWFTVELSSSASKSGARPFAYVQISSELITRRGPVEAQAALRAVVEALGIISVPDANVSRVDPCVDFTTTYPLASFMEDDWISRVRHGERHIDSSNFSGWSFGKGGDVVARLYDKTLEMRKKNPREYLKDEWAQVGWQPDQQVWRLEFQYRRNALLELGAASFTVMLQQLGGLWAYGMESWLRLTDPTGPGDKHSRPIHPLWLVLTALDWGTPRTYDRTPPPKNRPPKDHRLFLMSDLTGFMGREGIFDPEFALLAFWDAARTYHERRAHFTGIDFLGYLVEKARNKARLYNTILNQPAANDPEIPPDDPVESPEARAYRKERDGE